MTRPKSPATRSLSTGADVSADGTELVQARALTKRFGEFVAVDAIDVTVSKGEAFGFLGPNGAGKTSTMRMIGCVSPRSGGDLTVLGMDPDEHPSEIKARLGVVPQDETLDIELSVRLNLLVYGRYFDIPRDAVAARADELLEFAQLADRADARVEDLSGGMKRRLTIARALINDPDLILLDEPTTGLDPQARHLLWDRLYRLKQQGVSLILTTHYMDEAEQLCDRLVVMDQGRIVAEGSPRALIERYCTREVLELRFNEEGQDSALDRLVGLRAEIEPLPDRLLVYADHGDEALAEVHANGVDPVSALVRRSTLEDVFLKITGRSLID